MKPRNDNGMSCPLWRKACAKVCHTCEFWDHIRGKHPQTGADMDHWACTMKMQTYLSIENTMVARQTTASLDALRKEVNDANCQFINGTLERLNSKLDRQMFADTLPQRLEG